SASDRSQRRRKGQGDRVASGNIGDPDPRRELGGGPVLGNRNLGRERGPAESPQVEFDDVVPCYVEGAGDTTGRRDLDLVTLTIVERERVDVEPLVLGQGQRRGRVDPTAQQCDGFRLGIGHLSESYPLEHIGTVTS